MTLSENILITGANGFIGSFMVEEAVKRGMNVWAGVRKNSNLDFIKEQKIHYIHLHYEDKSALVEQIKKHVDQFGKWKYVIHSAGVTKSIDKEDFERINYGNTKTLVEAFIDSGYLPDKFVFLSSLSVEGPGDEKNYSPFRIDDTPRPNTRYGLSKLKAETVFTSLKDLPYIILRPTGVYGPREKDYLMMLKSVRMGWDINIGHREQHLTFIYVRDLVKASFLALKSNLSGKIYFVSDGKVYTDREYTDLIKKILGKKLILRIRIPVPVLKLLSFAADKISSLTGIPSVLNEDKFKIMKQRNWECDTEPIGNDLSFRADYDLEKGLRESIDWYKSNNWL